MAQLRLVASDLDGTLLRSDSTLSARTAAALRAARAAGIRVVLATARPYRVLPGVLDDDLFDVALCANGAVHYDPGRRAHVVTDPLPAAVATFVMTEVDRLVPGTFFAAETGVRVVHEAGYTYRPSLDSERYCVPSRAELVAEPLVKLMALLPHDDPAAAWATLEPSLAGLAACTWSSGHAGPGRGYPAILEIGAAGVSKAAALAQLCRRWAIGPAQVAAFGDARNDLEMLVWAGAGYAVANAAPEVLAAVPRRAPSNDEDGVARTLELLLASEATAER